MKIHFKKKNESLKSCLIKPIVNIFTPTSKFSNEIHALPKLHSFIISFRFTIR